MINPPYRVWYLPWTWLKVSYEQYELAEVFLSYIHRAQSKRLDKIFKDNNHDSYFH